MECIKGELFLIFLLNHFAIARSFCSTIISKLLLTLEASLSVTFLLDTPHFQSSVRVGVLGFFGGWVGGRSLGIQYYIDFLLFFMFLHFPASLSDPLSVIDGPQWLCDFYWFRQSLRDVLSNRLQSLTSSSIVSSTASSSTLLAEVFFFSSSFLDFLNLFAKSVTGISLFHFDEILMKSFP